MFFVALSKLQIMDHKICVGKNTPEKKAPNMHVPIYIILKKRHKNCITKMHKACEEKKRMQFKAFFSAAKKKKSWKKGVWRKPKELLKIRPAISNL